MRRNAVYHPCRSCGTGQIAQSLWNNGTRNCPKCRSKRDMTPKAHVLKEQPKTTRSWWIDVPQGQMTATAQQEVPRMRRGVNYYSQALNREGGHKLLKRLRSEL